MSLLQRTLRGIQPVLISARCCSRSHVTCRTPFLSTWSSSSEIASQQRVSQSFYSSTASTAKTAESPDVTSSTTHFGFSRVPTQEKEKRVGEVFEKVADVYDVMNDVMSAGVHRVWKDHFVSRLSPQPGLKLLDMAGGTGDISFRVMDAIACCQPLITTRHASGDKAGSVTTAILRSSVTVSDINPSMLEVGQKRAIDRGYFSPPYDAIDLRFQEANAEKLPFEDDSFDAYTIAFGIRNCTNVDQVLREAYRVLKPGGRFMCLEFSHLPNPVLQKLYDLYSFSAIPLFGQLIANDRPSYQYLVESIRQFPDQQRFAQMIADAGFSRVFYENMTLGVVAMHSGFKFPSEHC
mmetsp:Transcript_2806/g.8783  ORF Transcript_2806/g.8783 Transcript_2806/m.8783 type:complete len:350 (+) Transcript_2806:107-1156(+)